MVQGGEGKDSRLQQLDRQHNFLKGTRSRSPLFEELIIKEYQTLADSFILAEKHALWDKARREIKVPKQLQNESKAGLEESGQEVVQQLKQVRG